MIARALHLAVVIWLAAFGCAVAQTPPALRINDPFAAPLWRIDVDAAGRHIVSAAANNSLTLWSLEDGARQEILRVPLRTEERQRAHAIAISPDGERIAYGVPPLRDAAGLSRPGTARIYVLARNGGAILHIIEGVETRPQILRFSPDGDALAAGLSDGCGLRVWSSADWSLMASDDAGYGGEGDAAGTCCAAGAARDCDRLPDTPGLQFTDPAFTDVWLITSGDTGLRTYARKDGKIVRRAHKRPADIGIARPEGMALSPDGTRLAVGDRRIRGTGALIELKIAILDAATLELSAAPLRVSEEALLHPGFLDPEQVPPADQMSLNRVAWASVDGEEWIYAGGTLWCQIVEPDLLLNAPENPALDVCAVRWRALQDDGDDTDIAFIPVGIDRIMDLAFVPGHDAVVYATQRRIGALDSDGELFVTAGDENFLHRGRGADFRDRLSDAETEAWLDFAISNDGQTVYFEDYRSTADAPVRLAFSVNGLSLDPVPERPGGLVPPALDPILVAPKSTWWNQRKPPVLYDLALDTGDDVNDIYRAVALSGKRRALIGSANFLRLVDYAKDAARVMCRRRISAEAFRVNITSDGSLAVVGHSDGTLRWYRVIDGEAAGTCSLEHVLSVHISETEWGSDTWTWTAWIPSTGQFASDAAAKPLLHWQVTRPDGQVASLRHGRMLDLYDRSALAQALSRQAAANTNPQNLQARVARSIDPVTLTVLAPGDLQPVDSGTVSFTLSLKGDGTWPRNLNVELGTGVRAMKIYNGQAYAADEAVEIASAGDIELDVRLPAAARRRDGNFHTCFVLDATRTCHTLNWAGELEVPRKRRLWATIVGFSDYDDDAFDLRYAQNDALDLARLFIDDHRLRTLEGTSGTAADFDTVRIDLIVSPTTPTAKAELARLAEIPFVFVHDPSVANVLVALKRTAAQDRNEELSNDLMLFYFSGHGLLHPYNTNKGRTALLGPGIDASLSRDTMLASALTSADLLDILKDISAEKLVILDACRTTSGIPAEIPFDPGAVNKEFEEQVLSAHFLFSARAGQYSVEQKDFVFSSRRPEAHRGNGLFTYALLTDPKADIERRASGRNKIEVWEIGLFLDRFFDPDDAQSAARKLIDRLRGLGIATTAQQPKLVPARQVSSDISVVRSLDRAAPE